MWRMVGVPDGIAVKVGDPGEVVVLRTLFTIIALVAIGALFAPTVVHRLDLDVWAGG
jgi:hypothetical protein